MGPFLLSPGGGPFFASVSPWLRRFYSLAEGNGMTPQAAGQDLDETQRFFEGALRLALPRVFPDELVFFWRLRGGADVGGADGC